MEELQIDWNQLKPTSSELAGLWNAMTFSRLDNWTLSAKILKEKLSETHCNGGIQIHKYKVSRNCYFDWFAQRNRLNEIEFLTNVLSHNDIKDYRADLEINDDIPKARNVYHRADIYDLPGTLSRSMGFGGTNKRTDAKTAWTVATNFVQDEFENRFEEFITYEFAIETAKWFHDTAWDYSILLFDKRKYEIIMIDITDTD